MTRIPIAQVIQEPYRSLLVAAGEVGNIGAIDLIRAAAAREFPRIFRPELDERDDLDAVQLRHENVPAEPTDAELFDREEARVINSGGW